VKSQKICRNR